MKRIIVLICYLALSSAQAQWMDPAPVGGDIYYNGGNIGIGVSNPKGKLEIESSETNYRGIILSNSSNSTGDLNGGSPGIMFTRHHDAVGPIIKAIGSGPYGRRDLVFLQHDAEDFNSVYEAVRLRYNGNVGIGVTDPRGKLQVESGESDNRGIVLSNASDGTWNGGSPGIMFTRHHDAVGPTIKAVGAGPWGRRDLVFLQHNAEDYQSLYEAARFTHHGNLLIGKISQANTSHKLDIAGSVRANEIVVNTTGADYVFGADYKRKSLREVESFIHKNGHLPGIPSAEEMQESGMAVGELNTKLLEKIEELTLYVIELERENSALKENLFKIDELANRLKSLENALNE